MWDLNAEFKIRRSTGFRTLCFGRDFSYQASSQSAILSAKEWVADLRKENQCLNLGKCVNQKIQFPKRLSL